MKQAKKILAIIAVMTLIFTTAGCSSSKLKVGLESGFEPFEFNQNGKVVGIDVDIANAIAKDMGKTLDINDMPFDSVLAGIPSGKVDLGISGISITADRAKNMDFSNPYFHSNQLIVIKKGNTTIKGIADLTGKKIGAQSGTTGETLANTVKDATVSGYNQYSEAVLDLINGKIDAIVMDQYPAKANVAKNSDKIVALDQPLGADEYCIAIKKGNKTMVDEVNKVLKKLSDSGDLQKIIDKYASNLEK